MANEATFTIGLTIEKDALHYRSGASSFLATVTGVNGPTPGAVSVSTSGTDIDLSQLTTPGIARITNLDPTNFIEFGMFDGDKFTPLGEVLPGEFYLFRFSRNLGLSYGNIGTGTSDSGCTFRVRADTAACVVVVEAFEV